MEVLWSQMKRQVAACDAPLFNYAVKRADPRDLLVVFYKYASVEHEGERFMTPSDLIRDFLQMDAGCFNPATLNLLSGVVDETKDGLISFPEFQAFESMLCTPDAKFKLLFRLFDLDGKGSVTLDEFKHILETMTTYEKIPFDFESPFIKNYFGKEQKLHLSYNEFTQFIQEFQREYLRQAFFKKPVKEGSISSLHFSDIMKKLFPHMLSGFVLENLSSVATESAGRRVTFTYCVAFKNLLENLTTMEQIIKDITDNDKFLQVTKEEVLHEISSHPQVSPLQVEILFQLCNLGHPSIGKISLVDVHKLKPKHNPLTVFSKIAEIKTFGPSELEEPEPVKQPLSMQVLESLYKFSLGSVAGAAGATAVYPIDLVKTRMQNQRSVLAGEIMYKNSFDCFAKTVRNEGIIGLYRGLLPQLVGVSPEKAIKLTTNDFCRAKLKDKEGEISLLAEVISGGAGGAAQVMFTNPIEIVKIRMQIAGETGVRPSAIATAAELGFVGLYKGARACFLRDIPFSAIYFPCYAHLKTKFADREGYNKAPSLLAAATLAGVPAAYLVTPADVIKTRLQVKARRGQQTYRGVIDCFRKVWAEEGGKAFWKGGPARIFRSSPQFGVTLLTYESLQRLFYLDFGGGKVTTELAPQNPEVSRHPDHIGGLRLAVATFSSVETKFGLFLPKFNSLPEKGGSKPPPPSASPVSLGTTGTRTQS